MKPIAFLLALMVAVMAVSAVVSGFGSMESENVCKCGCGMTDCNCCE